MLRTIASVVMAVSNGLDTACRWLLCTCGMAMAIVTAAQVFFRYVLNNSLFWSEELGRVLLIQLTFFGAAVALKAHAHIGLDFMIRNLSEKGRKYPALLVQLLSSVFFFVMMWYGFQFALFLKLQSTATLGISRMIPFLAIPVSGAIMLIHSLSCFFEILELTPQPDSFSETVHTGCTMSHDEEI
ncbi:TRAP transporter small permease [Halodesulfovibrio marinisediminis]|uniref:TRAP-type C4-dicarboxylate transport system, small permease component n=1 Tax=Halodesulfovibrio marinisediminis DSM 17456 TaxID=1121457 RepID=A0A1N6FAA8_9BACT|nr:TRAP transporter small permease [Halodesulfovibrio marinisediminis]SIN92221.1 TRAP-type C4-dicarboxylate transport system, small permease component [Halodesulfovibrio marinisediminis DSM 17456]